MRILSFNEPKFLGWSSELFSDSVETFYHASNVDKCCWSTRINNLYTINCLLSKLLNINPSRDLVYCSKQQWLTNENMHGGNLNRSAHSAALAYNFFLVRG